MAVEIKRNKKTGVVEVWKDGEKTGEIRSMGEEVKKKNGDNKRSKARR